MSLVPYTVTALQRDVADAALTGKQVIATAVVTMTTNPDGVVAVMYDDAVGTNGATSKLTNANGFVVVWVEAGAYSLSVNGTTSQVNIGKKEVTTTQLITQSNTYQVGNTVTTVGYAAAGDGGDAQWVKTATTGTVSQAPSSTTPTVLNDADGNQWAKVAPNSYTAKNDNYSEYYDQSGIDRNDNRVFSGSAAVDASGEELKINSNTFIAGADFGSYYLERAAQNLSISKRGGIGTVSGADNAARYTSLGYVIWTGLNAYSIGDKVGAGGRLYTATVAGTSGTSPPSHTSGTATDGTVTWQYDTVTWNVAIGEAACALSSGDDGSGTWARYTEVVRMPAGGTSFAEEIVAKNRGSDVINNPYSIYPAKSTIGHLFAGGGDNSQGASTAPSTCGILFAKNGNTWNKGIVFSKDSIAGADGTTGFGTAISMGKGHIVNWFTPEGLVGAEITSQATLNTKRGAMLFNDNYTEFRHGGTSITFLRKLNDASTGAVALWSYGGNARVAAESTATDADLELIGKGAGHVKFGTHSALASETVSGYITIKDSSGTLRKVAVVS